MSTLCLIKENGHYVAVDKSEFIAHYGRAGMKRGYHIYGDYDYTPVGKPAKTEEEQKIQNKQTKQINRINKRFDRNFNGKGLTSREKNTEKRYLNFAKKAEGRKLDDGLISARDKKRLNKRQNDYLTAVDAVNNYNRQRKAYIDLIKDPDSKVYAAFKEKNKKDVNRDVVTSLVSTSVGAALLASTGYGFVVVPTIDEATRSAMNAEKTMKEERNQYRKNVKEGHDTIYENYKNPEIRKEIADAFKNDTHGYNEQSMANTVAKVQKERRQFLYSSPENFAYDPYYNPKGRKRGDD